MKLNIFIIKFNIYSSIKDLKNLIFKLKIFNKMGNNKIESVDKGILSKKNTEKKTTFWESDYFGVLILTICYFFQGIPIGFFASTISVLLAEKGASFGSLGTLSFVLYPFSFKIFFAPFEDYFYSKKFGKRKSYIIPIQYLMALECLIISFYIQDWIDSKSIFNLTAVGIKKIIFKFKFPKLQNYENKKIILKKYKH